MERWQNDKEKEVWRENVIYAVKYGLEHSNYTEKLQKLNETIQENDEKIQDICQANQKNLTDNLKQFTDINQDIIQIYDKIKVFENNIQVIIKMNIYNSKKICDLLEAKKNIDAVIGILGDMQDFVTNVEKAVSNVKGDNFMASLRILNGLKKANLIAHPANASMRKILSEVLPLINGKIRKLTDDLISEWMKQLKNKRSEYASFLINKMEEGNKKKGSRPTVSGNRMSMARESIGFNDVKFGNNLARDSAGPRGFQRKSTAMLGIDSKFMSNIRGYREYSKKELTQDLKVDFYLFNQCKQIYENLNETPLLYENVVNLRRNQMLQACGLEHSIDVFQIKSYLANIISFFLIQKEIEQSIPEVQDINQLWVDAGKLIEREVSKVVANVVTKEDYLSLKNDIQIFIVILNKFGFNSQALLLNEILKASYIKFSEKLIKDAKDKFTAQLEKEKNKPLVANNVAELRDMTLNFEIDKIVGLNLHADPTRNKYPIYLNYTQIVPDICHIVLDFINDNVLFMQGNPDSESILIIQLDRLLFEIFKIYYDSLNNSSTIYNPLQVAQIYQNAIVSQNLMVFFKKNLEKASGFQYKGNLESRSICAQITYACDEIICESIKSKLNNFLENYEEFDWAPNSCVHSKSDMIVDTLNYLNTTLLTMKQILPENTISIAFVAFKYINDYIVDILLNKAPSVNSAGLANIELDLISIFNVCETSLKEIDGLRECFRLMRQLLDLFLVGPFNEFADPNIRAKKYFCLDPKRLIPLMDKYKKIILPNMKELRKRDVDAVASSLRKEFRLK